MYCSYPVVVEIGESECYVFDVFYEVVGCFCGTVGDLGYMPVGDLVMPTLQSEA